jgi:hypothetical protein
MRLIGMYYHHSGG